MSEQTHVEETWVTTTEGAEITGYNAEYLERVARKMRQQPENERVIKIRFRSRRYELWLPDLMNYIQNFGYGPRKSVNETP
jgi:hypothetical protein